MRMGTFYIPPETNVFALSFRRHPPLLCEGNHTATRVVRNLSAKDVAFTRLLMHLAGVIGAASAPREWENKARAMLSPGQAKPQTARPWQPWLCAGNVLTLPIFGTYAECTQSG